MFGINSDEVSSQIQYRSVPDEWKVFHPPEYPLIALIFYGVFYVILWPLICTMIFGLLFWFFIQPDLVRSSFWPMYTTYPILDVIAVTLPFFLTWLVWRFEKRDRDTHLVLLPGGFVQYKPWSNERKRGVRVIEYGSMEEIVCKNKPAGIVLDICYKDGRNEKIFITRKYSEGIAPRKTTHQEIVQQIINDQGRFNETEKLFYPYS